MSDSFDAAIVARTIYGEARGEPPDGKLAVAYSIVNRWKSKRWFAGKTLASTAMKADQYTCWSTRDPNREKMCDLADADLAECQAAALAAILGTVADPTDGCTHYHAAAMETYPSWALGKAPRVTIGRHHFYKGVD